MPELFRSDTCTSNMLLKIIICSFYRSIDVFFVFPWRGFWILALWKFWDIPAKQSLKVSW